MADISNKTLAVLVVLAIVVSLVGIFSIHQGGLTGAAFANTTSQLGTTNFTVATVVTVVLDDNAIQFGTGIVNSSISNNATLDSFNATTAGGEGFVVGNHSTSTADSIHIRNAGNVDFALDVNSSQVDVQLINGTDPAFFFRILNSSDVSDGVEPGMGNASFLYKGMSNDTAGACASGALNGTIFGDGNFSSTGSNSTVLNATNHRLCSDFQFEGTQNEMDFFVQLRVPQNSAKGERQATLTFIATG